jgi:hypothetical protein
MMPMSRATGSLPAGRSTNPLNDSQVRTVTNTLLGYESNVAFRHDPHGRTRFVVETSEEGEDYGAIYFGPDVYPGRAVADPNSALSMTAALAHEVSHYHRWKDCTELPLDRLVHLDEAFTSLDAVLRFPALSPHDVAQLVRDALARLQLHAAELDNLAATDT